MDRLIKTAWRAFWVGLGAAAVLVSQSVLSPSPATAPAEPAAAPLVAPTPLLSDTKSNPLQPRCATVADVTRCS